METVVEKIDDVDLAGFSDKEKERSSLRKLLEDFEYDITWFTTSSTDCANRDSSNDRRLELPRCSEKEIVGEIREAPLLPSVAEFRNAQEAKEGDLLEYADIHESFLCDEDGVFSKHVGHSTCVVVPSPLQERVLKYFHGSSVVGHVGTSATLRCPYTHKAFA